MKSSLIILATAFLAVTASINRVTAQGTAFTYQGRLTDGATAANGSYEFRFALYDSASGGVQIGSATTNSAVAVTAGSFTVALNFGAGVFPGADRWLQIGVRTNGSGVSFTALNPRQALTATPYAQTAGEVTGANIARLVVANTATQATGAPILNFGFIVNATLTAGGSGYSSPPTVTVNDTSGSGAVITASVSGGAVVGLTVQSTGNGYTANATLTIAPPPSNAYQTFAGVNYFSGVNTMNNANNTFAGTFTGDGAGLTALNASRLGSGTLADGRLSANVPLRNASQTFSGANSFINPANSFVGNGAGLDAINGAAIAPASISGTSIANGAVTAAKIAGGQVVKSINGVADAVTLSAGTNITLTPAGNNLQISAAPGGLTWRMVSATTLQAQPNAGYLLTNSALVIVTLPSSPNPGDVVRVSGSGGSGWRISQNPGQIVSIRTTNAPVENPPGANWVARENTRDWSAVASSADGTKLVAAVSGGQIYTSTDSGVTWAPRDGGRNWASVASSADGTRLVAAGIEDQIYTSVNSGATWTPRDAARTWYAMASSADGTKLAAVVYGGQIYTSTDSGLSWLPHESLRNWFAVASSADGTRLVAADNPGNIYTSTDSGASWVPQETARNWFGVASSADGTKLVAVVSQGKIYTSADSGLNWTARDSDRNWSCVASSEDGTRLVAGVQGGQVYTSTDSGLTWTPRESERAWISIASSGDGTRLVAVDYGGRVYTSTPDSAGSGTTQGTTGYLLGEPNAAIELQYVGSGRFIPLSHEGSIVPH